MGGRLHTDRVVNGTGDAQADVEIRRDSQARLPDLLSSRSPALVTGNTGRAHGTTQGVGKGMNQLEVAVHAAATAHDGGGIGQGHAFLLVGHAGDNLNHGRLGAQLNGEGLGGQGCGRGHRCLVDNARRDTHDGGLSLEDDAHRPGTTQGGLADLEDATVERHGGGTGDDASLGEGGDAASDLATAVVRGHQHQAVGVGAQSGDDRVRGDDRGMTRSTQVGVQDAGGTQLCQGSRVGDGGDGQRDHVTGGQRRRERHRLARQGRQAGPGLVGQDEDRGMHLLRHVTSPPKECSQPARDRPRQRPE